MDIAQLAFEIDSSKARRAAGDLGGVSKAAKKAETASERMEREVNSLTGGLGRLRNVALSAVAAIGGFAAIRGVIGEIAEFERGLIGVSKTTGIVGPDLQGLADDIREIGERVPVSTTELLALGQSAGQLGVKGRDNIARFTETIAKLGTASDLAGEEAATAFARILTVTGTPISEVDRLGASIVQLGNNFAATESEISSAATRVAQSTSQFGVGADEVLGIGAALRSVGVEAEAGGTQIGLAFQSINDAIRNGGEQMRLLQEVTGETSEALRQSFFGGESTQVFEQFVQGLGRIQDSGGDVSAVLEEFDLNGTRAIQVLGTLATRSGVLSDALSQASTGYEENVALNREAEVASQSLSDQLQILRNSFSNLLTGTDISSLTESVKDLSAALQSAEVKESAQEIVQFAIDLSKEAVIAAEDLGGLIEEIKDLLNIDTETERVADLSVELVQLNRRLEELEEFDGDGVAANLMSPFGQNASKPIQEIRDRIAEVEKELYDIPLATRSVTEALDRLGQYGILTDFRPAPGLSQTPLIFRAIAEEGEKAGAGAEAAGDGLGEASEAARQARSSFSDVRAELELERRVLEIRAEKGEEAAEAYREEARLRQELNGYISETTAYTQADAEATVADAAANRELNAEIEAREEAEQKATEAAEKAAQERAEIAKREAEMFQRPFENAVENVQRSFGDMFTDIYRGGTDIFEDFAGTIKDIFARLAGEITALFVTRGLGSILQGAFGGGGGILGGGGGGLGSLLSLGGSAASLTGFGPKEIIGSFFGSGGGAGSMGGWAPGASVGGAATWSGVSPWMSGGIAGASILGNLALLENDETRTGAAIGSAIVPVLGTQLGGLIDGLVSAFSDADQINAAPLTVAAGSGSAGAEAGVLRDSPFGQVGLSRPYGRGEIPGDVIRGLTQQIADFDEQVAGLLSEGQVGSVAQFLQSQDIGRGMGDGPGTGFGTGVDDEDIADLLANRFGQIFDAIDLEVPETVAQAMRNKVDQLGISTEAVLESGFGALQDNFARLLNEANNELQQAQQQLAGTAGELSSFQDFFANAGQNISQFLERLEISQLDPQALVQRRRSEFEELLSQAQGGDTTAISGITSAADELLRAREQFSGEDSDAFMDTFEFVQEGLKGVQDTIGEEQQKINDTLTELDIKTAEGNQTRERQLDEVLGALQEQAAEVKRLNAKLERLAGRAQ